MEDTCNTKFKLTNTFQCDTIDLRFYNRLLICIGTVHMYCLDNKRCCEFIESEGVYKEDEQHFTYWKWL